MKRNDLSRREFGQRIIAAGAAIGAGSVLAVGCGKKEQKKEAAAEACQTPVAVQLYTLRDLMKKDFRGTIEKVAQIGYDAVEFAGYGGLSAQEVKKLLDDLGLLCAGTHEGFGGLEKNTEERIEFNLAIGNKYIVCPSMPGPWRKKGVDGIKAFGEKMNEIGAKIKKAGMQLAYHNHSFEFGQADGKTIMEYLLQSTDPDLVKLEVDVYWVKRGDVDPATFLKEHPERVRMLHMKDMADDKEHSFAPVGTGILDMKGIVAAARQIGVVWFIVEQDRTKRPVLEAIEISLKNMRELLKA